MIHASFEGITKNFCIKPVRHTGDTAAGLIQKLRSFSCIAIFQLSRFTRFPLES